MAEQFGQVFAVFGGQQEPCGPLPSLVGFADADVEDEPVESAGADLGVAECMGLPWAGDGHGAGMEFGDGAVHGEGDGAGFKIGNFDAFVAVPAEAPVLRAFDVPEAHRQNAGQLRCGQGGAGIAAVSQGVQVHFAGVHRSYEGFAAVGLIGFVS